MPYCYSLQADAAVGSIPGAQISSGTPAIDTPINVQLTLSLKYSQDFDLIADAPVNIPLPGPSSESNTPFANVLIISITGPMVKATITTPVGTAQVLPIDSLIILHSTTDSPISALTLTRTPGVDTLASVFLGQI